MKKFLIITSVFLISLSIATFTLFLFSIDFNFRNLRKTVYHEQIIEDQFSSVSINCDTGDVSIQRSNSNEVKVGFSDTERKFFTAEVVDGTLKINYMDDSKWYLDFFNFADTYVVIYLPEQTYESLTVDNSTGDINVNGFTATGDINIDVSTADIQITNSACVNANIDLSTGDININNLTAADVNVETTTGDIEIDNSVINNLKANTTTGEISLEGLTVNDTIDLSTDSGDKSVENVTAKSATITTNTGDVELENFILSGDLLINTNTGKITISNSDCANAKITTTTGDVIGRFLTDKIYITYTNTGDIRVPHSSTGGVCEITTTSGDIIIGYEEIDD